MLLVGWVTSRYDYIIILSITAAEKTVLVLSNLQRSDLPYSMFVTCTGMERKGETRVKSKNRHEEEKQRRNSLERSRLIHVGLAFCPRPAPNSHLSTKHCTVLYITSRLATKDRQKESSNKGRHQRTVHTVLYNSWQCDENIRSSWVGNIKPSPRDDDDEDCDIDNW